MITGERKPFEEIRAMVAPFRRILVLGCGTCVAECAAGGEKEAGVLASQLRMAAKMDRAEIEVGEKTLDRQCVKEFVLMLDEEIGNYDAVLSLACGAGVQAVGDMYDEISVLPGLNTKFLGETKEPGLWVENCLGCGDCMLHSFRGICPLARCSKQLFNGPCGGSNDGMCELSPDVPCAWHLIVERFSLRGELERLEEIYPPKDWTTKHGGGPRRIVREDQRP